MSGPHIPDISHGKKKDIKRYGVDDIRYYYNASSDDGVTETHRGGKLDTANFEQQDDKTVQS